MPNTVWVEMRKINGPDAVMAGAKCSVLGEPGVWEMTGRQMVVRGTPGLPFLAKHVIELLPLDRVAGERDG